MRIHSATIRGCACAFSGVMLCFVLSGCIPEFQNPLADAKTTHFDAALVGTWHCTESNKVYSDEVMAEYLLF